MTFNKFLGSYGTTNKELTRQCDVSRPYLFSYIIPLKKAGIITQFEPYLHRQEKRTIDLWAQEETELITRAVKYGKSGLKQPEAIRRAITEVYGKPSWQYSKYDAFEKASTKAKVRETRGIRQDARMAEIKSLPYEFLGPAVDMVIHAIRSNPYSVMIDSAYDGARVSDSAIENIGEELVLGLKKDIEKYVSSHPLKGKVGTYKKQLLESLYRQWSREVCIATYNSGVKRDVDKKMKDVLDPREIDILTKRFGLKRKKYTLGAIGKEYHLSTTMIENIEKEALRKMAHAITDEDSIETLRLGSLGKRLYEKGVATTAHLRRFGQQDLRDMGFGPENVTRIEKALHEKEGIDLHGKPEPKRIETIRDLELDGRTFYTLLRLGYTKVDAIRGLTRKELESLPNVGKKSAERIENELNRHDRPLRKDTQDYG